MESPFEAVDVSARRALALFLPTSLAVSRRSVRRRASRGDDAGVTASRMDS
jgi:hypothetical protein